MKEKRERKGRFLVILAVFICAALVVAVYLGGFFYFQSHFLKGTVIDRADVSGLTVDELKEEIEAYSLQVIERTAEGAELQEEIRGKDIDLSYASEEPLRKLLKEQKAFLWFVPQKAEHRTEGLLTYEEEKLKSRVKELAGLRQGGFLSPQDAYIDMEDPETGIRIVEEVRGNALDEKKTLEAVQIALEGLLEEVNLEEAGCYLEPRVKADEEELLRAFEKLESYQDFAITYTFGKQKEVLDGETVLSWLSVEDFEVKLDYEKVEEFVAGLRKKYDSIFRPRKFLTSYGKELTLSRGDYGWWMNYEQEAKELAARIEAGESGERVPVYHQKAASYESPDYGTTYVEINLTAQHLFLYKNGGLVLESDFVSGNLSRGFDTPDGIYGITYKQRNATLNGEDYSTPVAYWMPFNGNIGMHDATWRREFGGQIYITNGSHGCINLPYSAAKTIYENVEKGTAVICYHLPGTEVLPQEE